MDNFKRKLKCVVSCLESVKMRKVKLEHEMYSCQEKFSYNEYCMNYKCKFEYQLEQINHKNKMYQRMILILVKKELGA